MKLIKKIKSMFKNKNVDNKMTTFYADYETLDEFRQGLMSTGEIELRTINVADTREILKDKIDNLSDRQIFIINLMLNRWYEGLGKKIEKNIFAIYRVSQECFGV